MWDIVLIFCRVWIVFIKGWNPAWLSRLTIWGLAVPFAVVCAELFDRIGTFPRTCSRKIFAEFWVLSGRMAAYRSREKLSMPTKRYSRRSRAFGPSRRGRLHGASDQDSLCCSAWPFSLSAPRGISSFALLSLIKWIRNPENGNNPSLSHNWWLLNVCPLLLLTRTIKRLDCN